MSKNYHLITGDRRKVYAKIAQSIITVRFLFSVAYAREETYLMDK